MITYNAKILTYLHFYDFAKEIGFGSSTFYWVAQCISLLISNIYKFIILLWMITMKHTCSMSNGWYKRACYIGKTSSMSNGL